MSKIQSKIEYSEKRFRTVYRINNATGKKWQIHRNGNERKREWFYAEPRESPEKKRNNSGNSSEMAEIVCIYDCDTFWIMLEPHKYLMLYWRILSVSLSLSLYLGCCCVSTVPGYESTGTTSRYHMDCSNVYFVTIEHGNALFMRHRISLIIWGYIKPPKYKPPGKKNTISEWRERQRK